jgi:hypothetical protein
MSARLGLYRLCGTPIVKMSQVVAVLHVCQAGMLVLGEHDQHEVVLCCTPQSLGPNGNLLSVMNMILIIMLVTAFDHSPWRCAELKETTCNLLAKFESVPRHRWMPSAGAAQQFAGLGPGSWSSEGGILMYK